MSKALLKKSIQILDDTAAKPIFIKESQDSSRKKRKAKSKKNALKSNQKDTKTSSAVEANVKKLLKLSNFKLNDQMVQAAFKRSSSRHYVLPEKEKAPEQTTSVFTEEDFARFAEEYTG